MPVAGFNRPGDGAGGLKIPDKLNFVANLNAKNQPATMADPVATLISKVSNLGYVGSKRWASGTTTVSSSTMAFSGGTDYYVTVSGLTFTPTVIVLTIKNSSGTLILDTIFTNSPNLHTPLSSNIVANGSALGLGSNGYVNSTGFRLPTDQNYPSVECKWLAIE